MRVKKVLPRACGGADPSGTTYYPSAGSWRIRGAVEVLITGTAPAFAVAGSGTTSYYAIGGAVVAMRTAATAPLTYLHGGHPSTLLRAGLGSTSLTTNASGQKVSEQRYKPFGEVRWASGAGMPTDLTFTGQRAGSYGTIFMSAREYLPSLGRFLSADTMVPGAGNPAAFNRYMYVLGNPLRFTDPTGQFTSDEVKKFIENQYGAELVDTYMNAWKSDEAFWKMLMDANYDDVLFAPTTKLGSGVFAQSGSTFAFASKSGLEKYQGFGPYYLVSKEGNREGYGPAPRKMSTSLFANPPAKVTQPLFKYEPGKAPVSLGYYRTVKYEKGSVWPNWGASGDDLGIVTNFLIPAAGVGLLLIPSCMASGVCAAVAAGLAVEGSIWSGASVLNNYGQVEYNLTISYQGSQLCGFGGAGCVKPLLQDQICSPDFER